MSSGEAHAASVVLVSFGQERNVLVFRLGDGVLFGSDQDVRNGSVDWIELVHALRVDTRIALIDMQAKEMHVHFNFRSEDYPFSQEGLCGFVTWTVGQIGRLRRSAEHMGLFRVRMLFTHLAVEELAVEIPESIVRSVAMDEVSETSRHKYAA